VVDKTPTVVDGRRTCVRLSFDDLSISDLPKLVDVAYALEDAKGRVRVEAQLYADNPAGLDESRLELSVRELLAQQGLRARWED
jgi:hypothetical protein